MKIKVGVSLRHVHLTKEDYNLLFDEPLTEKNPINQPGQFASNQTVTLKNEEKLIQNVRIIGPERDYTQEQMLTF